MADIVKFHFRSRKDKEKESDIVRAVSNHPELGEDAAKQLACVFVTGFYWFKGLSPHQVGLMHVIAAERNRLIPF